MAAGLTSDRSQLDETLLLNGQQRSYLVLSDEERAKGFVRPVRLSYRHVGTAGPKHPLRDPTPEERERFPDFAKIEVFPESERPKTERFWEQSELDKVGKGCGAVTGMASALAETYARQPDFYGGTFCVACRTHLPVGADGSDGPKVGT